MTTLTNSSREGGSMFSRNRVFVFLLVSMLVVSLFAGTHPSRVVAASNGGLNLVSSWNSFFSDDFSNLKRNWTVLGSENGRAELGVDEAFNVTALKITPLRGSGNFVLESRSYYTYGGYTAKIRIESCEMGGFVYGFFVGDKPPFESPSPGSVGFGVEFPCSNPGLVRLVVWFNGTEDVRIVNPRTGEVWKVYRNETGAGARKLMGRIQSIEDYNWSKYYGYRIVWTSSYVRFLLIDYGKNTVVELWERQIVNLSNSRARIYVGAWKEREVSNTTEINSSENIGMRVAFVGYRGLSNYLVESGLEFLGRRQLKDGSWMESVGVTSLVVLAYLNAGYGEDTPQVTRGLEFILHNVHPDGRICSDCSHATYETSLAVLALVATHNPRYSDVIERATQWLKDSQWDEDCIWGNVNISNPYYGGFGYGHESRPDLSNTQFALMALDAAGVPKSDPLWYKARVFLARVQNLHVNTTIPQLNYTVKWTPKYNPHNDGGFIYVPGASAWGGDNSYGSMTGAGIWGLLLTGVPKTDERVQAALEWVKEHYTWDENPGKGSRAQYYYYLSMSKALVMTVGIDGEIGGHRWYEDLVEKLAQLQKPGGYWQNPDGSAWENHPELTTAYAVLSLEYSYIPRNVKRYSWLTLVLHSNVDIHVYDPLGRHVGKNYATGRIEIQIPNATYEVRNGSEVITLRSLESGNYRVVLIGTGNGSYTLQIRAGIRNTTIIERSYTRRVKPGEIYSTNVSVVMMAGLTVHPEEPEVEETPKVQLSSSWGNVSLIPSEGRIVGVRILSPKELQRVSASRFPYGLFEFNLTDVNPGDNVSVLMVFSRSLPKNLRYLWYNGSRFERLPLFGESNNIVMIELKDGGAGDNDGMENGVILHTGGLVIVREENGFMGMSLETMGLVVVVILMVLLLYLKRRR